MTKEEKMKWLKDYKEKKEKDVNNIISSMDSLASYGYSYGYMNQDLEEARITVYSIGKIIKYIEKGIEIPEEELEHYWLWKWMDKTGSEFHYTDKEIIYEIQADLGL